MFRLILKFIIIFSIIGIIEFFSNQEKKSINSNSENYINQNTKIEKFKKDLTD